MSHVPHLCPVCKVTDLVQVGENWLCEYCGYKGPLPASRVSRRSET